MEDTDKRSERDLTTNAVAGTDKRGESEQRYGRLERESEYRPRHGDREREFQEQEQRLNKDAALGDGKKGAGSKTQGAFGKETRSPAGEDFDADIGHASPENARYRRDERHDSGR